MTTAQQKPDEKKVGNCHTRRESWLPVSILAVKKGGLVCDGVLLLARMLSACSDSRCDCDCLVSLKTSPMEDCLAVKLKYIWTRCRLQIANPLDKLVQGGWTTLFLRATTISCWGGLTVGRCRPARYSPCAAWRWVGADVHVCAELGKGASSSEQAVGLSQHRVPCSKNHFCVVVALKHP